MNRNSGKSSLRGWETRCANPRACCGESLTHALQMGKMDLIPPKMLPCPGHGKSARGAPNGVPSAMNKSNPRTKEDLSTCIREWAAELGFDSVGIAPAHPSEQGPAYEQWAEQGMAGEMAYLTREDAIAKRRDPSLVVPGARSAVVVAMNYYPEDEPESVVEPSRGIVARYARNDD